MAIDFSILQPIDIGGQFLAGMQAAQQARQQREQQQQAMQRAQQMQQDVAAWQSDMSPERTASLLMNYPEIKEQITSSQAVLNEAAKRDRLDFASRALMLSRAGQTDAVKAMAQQRVDAYRNAGKEREAQEAEAMLKAWELDPGVIERALVLDIATGDPELYKNLFAKTEKPYEAVAGVGIFLKRDIERAIAAGESVVQPSIPQGAIDKLKANPAMRGAFDAKYGAGSAAKVLGGGSGNATGGFPAAGATW